MIKSEKGTVVFEGRLELSADFAVIWNICFVRFLEPREEKHVHRNRPGRGQKGI